MRGLWNLYLALVLYVDLKLYAQDTLQNPSHTNKFEWQFYEDKHLFMFILLGILY